MHRLVIASLFIAGTAYAQAPGEVDGGGAPGNYEGGGAPGNVAPVVTDNPCGGCGWGGRLRVVDLPRHVVR